MTNTQKRIATAFYYGARDFKDVYKSANNKKLEYYNTLIEYAESLGGELRILTADKKGFTVGILYFDAESGKSRMKFVTGYKIADFEVGDYVKFARRVYASNVNKTVKRAWKFN